MDIGKRLRELREAKGLSQRELEHRTGMLCCYISRVENGHATPTLRVMERWANALGVELHELFTVGHDHPEALVLPERIPARAQERTLLGLFGQMPVEDRALLISLARELAKRKGRRG